MASRKEEKEQRRAEREQAEATEAAQQRRSRALMAGGAAALLAVIVVVVLIVASQSGDDEGGDPGNIAGVDAITAELEGIEQSGFVIGDPDAPVTIVEYGDLQCPACAAFSEAALPDIIESEVRSGNAKLEFRNWLIIGPDSETAARAALAASEQDRFWHFVELFYANQGQEGSGYINDEFLADIAAAAGVEDLDQWSADRASSDWDQRLMETQGLAVQQGLPGTPSIVVEGPGGTEVLGTPESVEQVSQAVQSVS
ncbi:MAG: DsbA family protein [Solirubrobacterales bacterium]